MKPNKHQIKAIKTAIRRGVGRSPLFTWMVDNHSVLIDKYGDGRMPWKPLCEIFAELGLTDATGKLPSENRACRTWRKACEEAERRKAMAAKTVTPQRSPRTNEWRPPVAEPKSDLRNFTTETQQRARQAAVFAREEPMPSRAARPASPDKKVMTYDDLSPEKKAKLDKVREEFRQADRKRAGNF